uniref:Iron-sulfur cluster formation ABC transporter n=1 Tax=Proboscia sp. TaxID=1923967 RepID=A0A2U9NM53_9STRA|nr:iron-sulfur cluster formation ABC transporter [Proboscia sp.]AWT38220.1 iron-sulfur cluster formation ABC transporter [Proboscia sp.]
MNTKNLVLEIKDLKASVNNVNILNNLSLKIYKGEIHAIMGPNGSGKSTFAKVVAGHPSYKLESGNIFFLGININDLEPEERAHLGIFLAFQYPVEIPGVTNDEFLLLAYNSKRIAQGKDEIDMLKMYEIIINKLNIINMSENFLTRNVNEGFSGGEKKRNEILQMLLLNPKLAILDETDSGLDIDALKIISDGINKFACKSNAIVLITHYQRLLDYIKPNYIHVMENGKIIKTGGPELAKELELKGYDWLK